MAGARHDEQAFLFMIRGKQDLVSAADVRSATLEIQELAGFKACKFYPALPVTISSLCEHDLAGDALPQHSE